MLKKLKEKQKNIVEIIKNHALEQNLKAYVVGGVVRDLILDKEIKDVDFLIEGSAIDFAKNAGLEIKSTHESFNTVKVEILGDEIDVASTRKEIYPNEGSLPSVQEVGIKIEDDLKRRDFTVNSIAINILTNEIIDPFCGKDDIKNGVLRVLHDKSFLDDPTRILRGLDFKYRFNFDFDKNTKKLIKEAVKTFNREFLSIDRIYLTLNKIFSSKNADKVLADILEDEIYKIWMNKTDLKKEEINFLVEVEKIFDIKEKSSFYIMALDSIPYVKVNLKDDFEIYEFYKKFKPLGLAFYYFKTKDESAIRYLKLKDIKPLIKGGDLIENGFYEGEIIGVILNSILKEKILNPKKLDTFEKELDFAIKNFK